MPEESEKEIDLWVDTHLSSGWILEDRWRVPPFRGHPLHRQILTSRDRQLEALTPLPEWSGGEHGSPPQETRTVPSSSGYDKQQRASFQASISLRGGLKATCCHQRFPYLWQREAS